MVPVDITRSMSNTAEGDFALAFANQFSRRGIPVVLILSRLAYLKHRANIPAGVEVIQFTTFAQYVERIALAVSTFGKPGYAMSSAAVSDYGFERPIEGKISSSQDVLELAVPKLPKVLTTWREQFGIECFIVGFKLLSRKDSTIKDVIAAARKQNKRARLNATIANLAEEIGGGVHPIWWVTPDGGVVRIDGHRDDVAKQVVEIMTRYRATHWHKSVRQAGALPLHHIDGKDRRWVQKLIGFAQGAGLLRDTSGNIAVDIEQGGMLVSPRAVDKSTLMLGDLIPAKLGDAGKREVLYWGPEGVKPSIDTSIHLHCAEQFKHAASLHFHDGWVIGDVPRTRMSYPCGTLEQALSIRETLARHQLKHGCIWEGRQTLMLEMSNHGHVLYLRSLKAVEELEAEWGRVVEQYCEHLRQIGREDFIDKVVLEPIFHGGMISGVVARFGDWHAFWLAESARKMGLGQQLIDLINKRDVLVGAHDNCGVKEFYLARGFMTIDRDEDLGVTIMQPPAHRDDLVTAATLTIHCTTTDRVLLVERGSTSFPGYHAHVGGRIEEGESALLAAIREAGEEIGVDLTGLPEPDPVDVSVHYTGWVYGDGNGKAFRVTNFLVRTLVEFETYPDGEEIVSADWSSRSDLKDLTLGHATKAALRKVWPYI